MKSSNSDEEIPSSMNRAPITPTIPKVSLIVVNYNGVSAMEKNFEICFRSLVNTDYENFDILFVDNGSSDSSVELVGKIATRNRNIKIVRCERNLGIAGAVKAARRYLSSHTKYIGILNNDVIFEPEWLKNAIAALEADGSIAAAYPFIFDNYTNSAFIGGSIDTFGLFYPRNAEITDSDKGLRRGVKRSPFIAGTVMVLRISDYDHVSGLDESFFLFYEEVDLAWRLLISGRMSILVWNSVVHHLRGQTASKIDSRERWYLGTRNRLVMILKDHDIDYAFATFAASLLLSFANLLLVDEAGQRVTSYFRAYLDVMRQIPRIYRERKLIRTYRVLNTRALLRRGLISGPHFFTMFATTVSDKNWLGSRL